MSAKTLLILSASVLLGAAVAAPNAALAQFGPPPGPPPMLAGPPPGFGAGGPPPGLAGGPPLGGPPAGPVAGLPRGGPGAPPRDLAGGPHLDGAAGLHGSVAADRPVVEARASGYGANGHIRNSYASYGYGHGRGSVIGRMRRPRLTPMADPTPPQTTAAPACRHTGDMAPGAFWSVMEAD